MKKRFIIAFLLIPMLLLNSCSFIAPGLNDDSESKADTYMNQIAEAINNRDKTNLTSIFSKKALSETQNFDTSIDSLFNFIKGKIVSWSFSSGSGDYKSDYGSGYKSYQAAYYVKTDNQTYLLLFQEYTVDTDHPDNVGVYMLHVVKKEDETDWENNPLITTAGIHIWVPTTESSATSEELV